MSKRGAAGGKAADKCNPLRGFTCPIQQAFHYPDPPGAAPVLTLALQSGLSPAAAERFPEQMDSHCFVIIDLVGHRHALHCAASPAQSNKRFTPPTPPASFLGSAGAFASAQRPKRY